MRKSQSQEIMKTTRNNKNLTFQDCYVVWGDPGYQLTKPDDLGEVSQHLARACLDDVDDLGNLVSTSALQRLKKVLMAQFGTWRLSVVSLSASISVQCVCVVWSVPHNHYLQYACDGAMSAHGVVSPT